MYGLINAKRPVGAKALIINAFALTGRIMICDTFTQGAALGYVLLPLRGVQLRFFDTRSSYSMLYNIRRMNLIPYLYHSFPLLSFILPRSKSSQIQTNVNLVHKSVVYAFIYQKA